MCANDTSGGPTHIFPIAAAVAIAIALGSLMYILYHEPTLALPSARGPKIANNDIQTRLAAADVTKETVSYIVSLTIALAAVAAFLVKDGFGSGYFLKSFNVVLTSLVAYYIIKSLLFAYDAYGMIAIQLSEGYFFVSRVQQVISEQAQKLVIALILTVGLVTARIR